MAEHECTGCGMVYTSALAARECAAQDDVEHLGGWAD